MKYDNTSNFQNNKPEGFLWNNLLIWEMFFGFGLCIESKRNEEGQAFLN